MFMKRSPQELDELIEQCRASLLRFGALDETGSVRPLPEVIPGELVSPLLALGQALRERHGGSLVMTASTLRMKSKVLVGGTDLSSIADEALERTLFSMRDGSPEFARLHVFEAARRGLIASCSPFVPHFRDAMVSEALLAGQWETSFALLRMFEPSADENKKIIECALVSEGPGSDDAFKTLCRDAENDYLTTLGTMAAANHDIGKCRTLLELGASPEAILLRAALSTHSDADTIVALAYAAGASRSTSASGFYVDDILRINMRTPPAQA